MNDIDIRYLQLFEALIVDYIINNIDKFDWIYKKSTYNSATGMADYNTVASIAKAHSQYKCVTLDDIWHVVTLPKSIVNKLLLDNMLIHKRGIILSRPYGVIAEDKDTYTFHCAFELPDRIKKALGI